MGARRTHVILFATALTCAICSVASAVEDDKFSVEVVKPKIRLVINQGHSLIFEVTAAVPLHRPAPEHFDIVEVGKETGDLYFREGTFAPPIRYLNTIPRNPLWNGGRIYITNRAITSRFGQVDAVRQDREKLRLVDLHAEANLEPNKKYRLTWSCWPVGASQALETIYDFDVRKHAEPTKDESVISLELKADKTTARPRDPITFQAEIFNYGKFPITLVKPGDGSDNGWRTPLIDWITNGREQYGRITRCGNINGLKFDEVVTIAPGKSMPFSEWIGYPSFGGYGEINIVLRYRNRPNLVWQGIPLDTHNQNAMQRITESPRVTLVSNAITIRALPDEPVR